MSWLTPIGFLGLIGLIILIIIYIIKPNYQQKIISSTFVWKLSLKYRRKKIPINHLRNLLIFICQVLIITSCAMILAQPFLPAEEVETYTEKVVIIDASASMRTEMETTTGKVTRFERAVKAVQSLADEVFKNEGMITVILADKEPSYLVQRATVDQKIDLNSKLQELIEPNNLKCSYGTVDIDAAIALAETITEEIPDTELLLYTDNSYIDDGDVTVMSMADTVGERNAAILDARTTLVEGYYRVEVDVAAYGLENQVITVLCQVRGANYEKTEFSVAATVNCPVGETKTVVFMHAPEDGQNALSVYSYETMYLHIEEDDSYTYDNTFYLYGGTKQNIKIQYASTNANNFFAGALMSMRDIMSSRWDIDVTLVNKKQQTPATEGFDVYIFEDTMPAVVPKDGLVILADPDPMNANLPLASGLMAQQVLMTGKPVALAKGENHPITNGIQVEKIEVTEYIRVVPTDANFVPLMYCGSDAVVYAKDEEDGKIVLIGFDLNFSNLAVLLELPVLMYNIFEYYIPSTITDYAYEVDETLTLNSAGNTVSFSGPTGMEEISTFPHSVTLTTPGTYSISYIPAHKLPLSENMIMEDIFVKIPASESNIFCEIDELKNPVFAEKEEPEDFDLIFYFALALVALLFIEWWLQSREHF